MNEMNAKVIWVVVGIILLLVLLLLGYISLSGPGEVATSTPSGNATTSPASYLANLKIIFTNEVYPTDYNQPNPRLRHYIGRVQNLGDKTVSYITLKVNYLDESGQPIKDEIVTVGETLKPNFIQEFQFGGLFVPAAWSGRVTYTVTELHFVGDVKIYYPDHPPRGTLNRPLPEIIIPLGL